MRARAVLLAFTLASGVLSAQAPPAGVPAPDATIGFRPGSDGKLAPADDIEKYFESVAAASDRVKLVDLGQTTERHRTIAAIVSSAENIRNLEAIRTANQQLADPRTLADEDARKLAASQKAVVAIGASIHATEIGATQTALELLHTLATASDAQTTRELDDLVVIVIPMLNPDGHRLVVDWYNKNKATAFEGGPMPWPDHSYAGHDINRDAFMMNLAESRNLARFFYREWHPQVFLSMHQMDGGGARFFTPPVADPIDPNVDPLIWREAAMLGSAMTLELERDDRPGVVSNSLFDYYSPGYEDTAPLGHNTVCLLTEAARVKVATPVNEPKSDDVPRVSAPHPWPGGPWTLGDIVEYEMSAVRGLLRAAAAYREDIVWNFYSTGRRAVEAGRKSAPFAYIVPPGQHDVLAAVKLEQLLIDGGVEIQRASEVFTAGGISYPAGSDIIFLAQPYRSYVKTLLERKDYPAGAGDRPYDVTGWTLPAQMGVDVRSVDQPFEAPVMSQLTAPAVAPPAVTLWGDRKPNYYLIETRSNAGVLAINRLLAAGVKASSLDVPIDVNGFQYGVGSLVVPAGKNIDRTLLSIVRPLALRIDAVRGKAPTNVHPLIAPRVGVYKPYGDNTDEGWTRWVLEQYEFAVSSISTPEMRAGMLRGRFDAIVLPNVPAAALKAGMSPEEVPAPFAGGPGDEGLQALDAFVRAGGTLVCLDSSCPLAVDLFKLPVKDVAHEPGDALVAPGTIVRLQIDTSDPLSAGMPAETAAFFASSSAYAAEGAGGLRTAATYGGHDPKTLLVSGLLRGSEVLQGRAAVVSARVAAGRVVLFGFPVQHRGQTLATFRLLFNALFQ
ncbi:MAG TPA: M14 family metallopeptidase [Vicinamibacterales bacterium]|nr:M14 family metallopeptidase [Vicinamibacterales bacterium]